MLSIIREKYNTIKKRIKLIEDYTEKYKKLTAFYDATNVAQIHNSTHKIDALQNSFTNAVVNLIKARDKFYYYINYDLVDYNTDDLKKTNKERFDMLRGITDNLFTTLQNDTTVNFRDFFIIIDNRRVTFTSYLTAKGLTGNSWFDYKKQPRRNLQKKDIFTCRWLSF